ncbi:MAG: Type 1 glutamine amidotransferase-like domain-containing protein, partial [Bacteroidota bacterium]
MSNVLRIFLLTMLLHPIQVFVQETPARSLEDQKPDTKGPERGRLLLLGGGITKHHAELIKKFAGGEKAKIIVIPTAYSDREIAKDPTFKNAKHRLKKLGISNITIIHTRDRDTANSEAFTAPIKKAGGLLLLGGRTQRITSAYLNTKTHTAITALLNRGGIIAGVSAGSGVQATYFS